jgi:hypothetical protein
MQSPSIYFTFIDLDGAGYAFFAEDTPVFLNSSSENSALEFGEMGNIKVSVKMLTMFGRVILFPKVGINVIKRSCVMPSFAQESASFDFREHRFPVMMWVREALVVKKWTRVRASSLSSG